MAESGADPTGARIFNILRGEAAEVRPTPYGDVGTIFSGSGLELVWVRKHGEPIDQDWFSSDEVDLILVVSGLLRVEFEAPGQDDRVLGPGELLILPAGQRCRAYRWPRDAAEATVFVAAYPAATGAGVHDHGDFSAYSDENSP